MWRVTRRSLDMACDCVKKNCYFSNAKLGGCQNRIIRVGGGHRTGYSTMSGRRLRQQFPGVSPNEPGRVPHRDLNPTVPKEALFCCGNWQARQEELRPRPSEELEVDEAESTI